LKRSIILLWNEYGRKKKSASPPRVLNPRPCTRTLCKCVTPGQGGLWLWVQQFFTLKFVYSCYWWPSLAPATVPQHCNSQISTPATSLWQPVFQFRCGRQSIHSLLFWPFYSSKAHPSTSQTTKMTSPQRPVNQTSDKQLIKSSMFYCKRPQNLIRSARRWCLFVVGFCFIDIFW